MSVAHLPLPQTCRSVEQALGAARLADINNCLIISETERGLLFINAGDGEPLTMAQCIYLLRRTEHVLMTSGD